MPGREPEERARHLEREPAPQNRRARERQHEGKHERMDDRGLGAQRDIAFELRQAEQQRDAVQEPGQHRVRREFHDARDAAQAEQDLHQSREQDAERERGQRQVRIGERRNVPQGREQARLDHGGARARRGDEPGRARGERRGRRRENGAAQARGDARRDIARPQRREGQNPGGEARRHGGRELGDAGQHLASEQHHPARRQGFGRLGHRGILLAPGTSANAANAVTPAKAGAQGNRASLTLGSRLRGNDDTPQNPLSVAAPCSTWGVPSKQWPTHLRHSAKSGEPRKSTVWFSSVSQVTSR